MTHSRVHAGRIACALLASTASIALAAAPAAAQTATTASAFPVRAFEDANGVDLLSGAFTVTTPGVVIGDAETGLSFSRELRSNSYADNILGTITVDGSVYTVSIGGSSEKFTYSNGSFVPHEARGSTLVGNSWYTYRMSDGTTASFIPAYGNFGNAAGISLETITYPSGKTLTSHFHTDRFPTPGAPPGYYVDGRRLQSVSSNTGYHMNFEYEYDYVSSSSDVEQWMNLVRVVGLNSLVAETPAAPSLTISPLHNGSSRDYTDSLNRTTRIEFGAEGIVGIRTPGNSSNNISIAYSNGKVASVTANGIATSYAYADNGNIRTTTVTNALGKSSVFTFDLAKLLMLTSRDPLNRTTTYTYDSNNRPVAIIQPEGNNVTYAYDARGNVITATANAKPGSGLPVIQTSASYDATCSNPVKCNKPNSTSDAYGRATDYTYDSTHGGVLSVTAPAPTSGAVRPQVRYTYARLNANGAADANGVVRATEASTCQTQASCIGTADEVKSTVTYGANQNVTSISSGAGNGSLTATSSFTYDAVGNKLTVDGPLAGSADTTRYRYDDGRRLVGVVGPDPDGGGALKHRAQKATYNTFGSVAQTEVGTVTDQSDTAWSGFVVAQSASTAFDGYGRPVWQKVSAGGSDHTLTQISYDALGRANCTALRMNPATWGALPANACSRGTEGSFGPDRVAHKVWNDAGELWITRAGVGATADEAVVTRTYTLNGKLQTLSDGENNRTTYEYDGFDRLSKTLFPSTTQGANASNAGDDEQLTYDNNGNVTSKILRDNQTVALTYDALNRPTLINKPGSDPDVSFTYDLLGRATQVSQPGYTLTYQYDPLGRRTYEGQGWLGISTQFDLAGRRTRTSWSDGFYVDYARLVTGELSQVRENGATSGAGLLASYAYDDLGRRTSLTRGNGTTTSYTFDPISRLTSLSHDLAGTANDLTIGSMSYNPASQIVSQTRSNDAYAWTGHVNVNRGYTLNGLNQYTLVAGAAQGYDGRGNLNLTQATNPATMQTVQNDYTFSSDNLLKTKTEPGNSGATVSLHYDPLGRLVEYNTNVSRRFQYDGAEVSTELAGSTITGRYVRGDGADEVLVWYIGSGTSDRRWLHADERGSIVAVSDGAGSVNINRYDEYGVPQSGTGVFRYTGQMWLPELGVYYYKARMYSPPWGRFLQTDPIGYGDGMNMYAYVGNDPVNMVDPSGMTGMPSADQLAEMIAASTAAGMAASCYPVGCSGPGGGLMHQFAMQAMESHHVNGLMSAMAADASRARQEQAAYDAAMQAMYDARARDAERNAAFEADVQWASHPTGHNGGPPLEGVRGFFGRVFGVVGAILSMKGDSCQTCNNPNITVLNGVGYTRHALDQMEARRIPPSVVSNTINVGQTTASRGATTLHYDPVNNITAITNSNGHVVTVHKGR